MSFDRFELLPTDLVSSTWLKIEKHLEERLNNLRAKNDNENLKEHETAAMRGRIAEIKAMLAYGKTQRID